MSMDRRKFVLTGAALGGGALAGCASGQQQNMANGDAAMTDAAAIHLSEPYTKPYIDIDEWRDAPVRHRYVHGGFTGTDLLFSMYFPVKEKYQGRFFQPLAAISGSENAAPMAMFQASGVGFAVESGGYLIESNQGAKNMYGGSWQANAAVAQYSRQLAAEMYGPHRTYGYVYGGSGGAFKTLPCVENTVGVWDGAIPFVHGTTVAIPSFFTVQAHAMRVLGPKFPQIVDAIDPGGSGDMYAGPNAEEREALKEVTGMGFPPRAWFNFQKIAFGYTGVFTTLVDSIVDGDPTYFEDFWTKPGYLGANPTPSLLKARIQHPTKIKALIMPAEARSMGLPLTMAGGQSASGVEFPAALRLESMPEGNLQGASIILNSGGAKGHLLYIAGQMRDIVMVGFGAKHFEAMGKLRAGDEVSVDNSVYLATQTYHRHIDPGAEFYVWSQFKGPDGKYLYPQRKQLPIQTGAETQQSGKFNCTKLMVMEAMMDEAAYPWGADWYRKRVAKAHGPNYKDKYRLYFIDNTMHTTQTAAPGDPRPVATTRVISYQGALQRMLRDLAAWVEKGVEPPPSTEYTIRDGQVVVPASAAARKGFQPTVTVTANGAARAEVKTGQRVTFQGVIEMPADAGVLTKAEWDFEGSGEYPVESQVGANAVKAKVETTYAFSKPGTYFPALRVSSRRRQDPDAPYAQPLNLGRVRVVVA